MSEMGNIPQNFRSGLPRESDHGPSEYIHKCLVNIRAHGNVDTGGGTFSHKTSGTEKFMRTKVLLGLLVII